MFKERYLKSYKVGAWKYANKIVSAKLIKFPPLPENKPIVHVCTPDEREDNAVLTRCMCTEGEEEKPFITLEIGLLPPPGGN